MQFSHYPKNRPIEHGHYTYMEGRELQNLVYALRRAGLKVQYRHGTLLVWPAYFIVPDPDRAIGWPQFHVAYRAAEENDDGYVELLLLRAGYGWEGMVWPLCHDWPWPTRKSMIARRVAAVLQAVKYTREQAAERAAEEAALRLPAQTEEG